MDLNVEQPKEDWAYLFRKCGVTIIVVGNRIKNEFKS